MMLKTEWNLFRLEWIEFSKQVWTALGPCSPQFKDAVEEGINQIYAVHRLIEYHPEDMMLVTSIQSINEAFVQGKLADMIGVEGEHAINSNLAILRTLYRSGARYLNLA